MRLTPGSVDAIREREGVSGVGRPDSKPVYEEPGDGDRLTRVRRAAAVVGGDAAGGIVLDDRIIHRAREGEAHGSLAVSVAPLVLPTERLRHVADAGRHDRKRTVVREG